MFALGEQCNAMQCSAPSVVDIWGMKWHVDEVKGRGNIF